MNQPTHPPADMPANLRNPFMIHDSGLVVL